MTQLIVRDLIAGYEGEQVLRSVSLQLSAGDFAALLGPNGAGKSTLLHCVAGKLDPHAGSIRVAGCDMRHSTLEGKRSLGLAIDPHQLPAHLTGEECLRLFAAARGLGVVPPETLALAEALALSAHLNRRVARYSLGMRQKLGLLLGLLGQPPLLLLDEPLNGLDPVSARVLKQHLQHLTREHGTAVLLATHAIDVAERYVNRALLLFEGCIRREWNADELVALRNDPRRTLEDDMVRALTPASST